MVLKQNHSDSLTMSERKRREAQGRVSAQGWVKDGRGSERKQRGTESDLTFYNFPAEFPLWPAPSTYLSHTYHTLNMPPTRHHTHTRTHMPTTVPFSRRRTGELPTVSAVIWRSGRWTASLKQMRVVSHKETKSRPGSTERLFAFYTRLFQTGSGFKEGLWSQPCLVKKPHYVCHEFLSTNLLRQFLFKYRLTHILSWRTCTCKTHHLFLLHVSVSVHPSQEPPLQRSSTPPRISCFCTSRVTSVWWRQAFTWNTRVSSSLNKDRHTHTDSSEAKVNE